MSNLGTAKFHDALSPATEDYLRALYKLGRRNPDDRPVTTSQLADRLAVRPASVTAMLQKLAAADPPLVEYHKSHGARLTEAGQRAALAVVRCHRLLELFLHEKLGYSWDEVHEEADRLEHVVGPIMVERLAAALGYPTRDPHGHAIPDADLTPTASAFVPLTILVAGQSAVIEQVGDDDPALLRQMAAAGLLPGVALSVLAGAPALRIALGGGSEPALALSPDLAARVFVRAARASS